MDGMVDDLLIGWVAGFPSLSPALLLAIVHHNTLFDKMKS